MKTVAFCTLGCKVNQYETNAMMQKMIEAGYEVVDFETKADIYIINTCTVTNMADKKSRQMLRRVKEINPEAILVAVGCYAQVAKEKLEQIPEIDLILGINEKNDIVELAKEFLHKVEGSINKINEENKLSLIDKISTGKNEEEIITNKIVVKELINKLDKKEKEVIMLRFYKEKTQSQVAKILGITQVQVSRIERRILNSMKLKLTS